jgi:hypothetical protein
VKGIAVDEQGNACVAGFTNSDDFPIRNAVQAERGGGRDAFVLKLGPDGSNLIYSTYLGGVSSMRPTEWRSIGTAAVTLRERPPQGTFPPRTAAGSQRRR